MRSVSRRTALRAVLLVTVLAATGALLSSWAHAPSNAIAEAANQSDASLSEREQVVPTRDNVTVVTTDPPGGNDGRAAIAAFAPDVLKVGVTRLWRLETRLREQGADRAAHVRTFPDGRVARQVEAELAEGDDLVDRVRVPTKLAGFGREVDESAWEALLERFDPIERFAFDYGLDLAERPVAETMAAGTVRGWKGRVLVLDRGGSTYAVDARELVGYELTDEVPGRELQSSLGAFGE